MVMCNISWIIHYFQIIGYIDTVGASMALLVYLWYIRISASLPVASKILIHINHYNLQLHQALWHVKLERNFKTDI